MIKVARHTEGRICQECGTIDELRPYGLGGMEICFGCAMKNEVHTKKMFLNSLGVIDE